MKIGCVLMAAGTASRFGENKLLYPLNGRSLIEWAIQAAPPCLFDRAVAVVSDSAVADVVRTGGFACVWNDAPELGQGTSIALGIQAMDGMDATMFCVADQPYLTRASVERLLAAYVPNTFARLSYNRKPGNPVIFPADSFSDLAALTPEQTGKAVLKCYPERIRLVEAQTPEELLDIDTKEDIR